MSSRRSSQVDEERRASLKLLGVPVTDSAVKEDQQQQPSPCAPKKSSRAKGDDDNNQAEEEDEDTGTQKGVVRPIALPPQSARVLHRATELEKQRQQGVQRHEPPLTTVRLRHENTALKLKINKLENQYETQLDLLKQQLTQVETARQLYEQNVKQQFSALEQRAVDATAQAAKYHAQVQQLTERLLQQEKPLTTAEHVDEVASPPAQTESNTLKPVRNGNGSPLPYKLNIKRGEIKPFAWRELPSETSAPPIASPPRAPVKTYRKQHYPPRPFSVAPLPARYIPIVPIMPDPIEAAPAPVPQRLPALEHPVNNLVSRCTAFISEHVGTRFVDVRAASSSANMKVMPAWMVQERLQNKLAVDQVPDEDTVINIPTSDGPADAATRTVL